MSNSIKTIQKVPIWYKPTLSISEASVYTGISTTKLYELTDSEDSEVPLWHRQNLSVQEAVAYTGIGRETIRKLIKQEDCDFAFTIGARTMIKRKRFEKYIEKMYSI